MTPIERIVSELERLEREATPGPWDYDGGWRIGSDRQGGEYRIEVVTAWNKRTRTPENRKNAALIASMRNHLRALLADWREKAKRIEELAKGD